MLLFSAVGMRFWLVSTLFIPFLFFVLRNFADKVGLALVATFCALFVTIVVLHTLGLPLAAQLTRITVMHNVANSGMMTGWYLISSRTIPSPTAGISRGSAPSCLTRMVWGYPLSWGSTSLTIPRTVPAATCGRTMASPH